MKRVYYCVQWCGSAPLSHAAFTRAYQVEPTVYRLEFPIDNPSLRRAKEAQYRWTQDVVRHLASWHIQGCIHEMSEKPGRPANPWTGTDERWAGQCAEQVVAEWCEDESIDVKALVVRWAMLR